MHFCPRCSKKFKDSSSVLKHMNQPISSCRIYYEELVQVNDTLLHPANENPPGPTSSHTPHNLFSPPNTDYDFHMDVDIVNPATQEDLPPQSSASTFPFFKETHPTASTVYGSGRTFMDIFDEDKYAGERAKQLYYPFASKDEWELASFLLRSHLSMASIDIFLKLRLVSISSTFPGTNFSVFLLDFQSFSVLSNGKRSSKLFRATSFRPTMEVSSARTCLPYKK